MFNRLIGLVGLTYRWNEFEKKPNFFLVLHIYPRTIGSMSRVFPNSAGDLGSIPSRVMPMSFKMVLDTSLLNTQQYKVHIKGKVG